VQILLVTRTNVLWEKLSNSVVYPDYLRKFPPNSGKLCGLPRHWQKFAREIDITDVNFSLVTRSICALLNKLAVSLVHSERCRRHQNGTGQSQD